MSYDGKTQRNILVRIPYHNLAKQLAKKQRRFMSVAVEEAIAEAAVKEGLKVPK